MTQLRKPVHRQLRRCVLLCLAIASTVFAGTAVAYKASELQPIEAGTQSTYGINGRAGPKDVETFEVQPGVVQFNGLPVTVIKTLHGPNDGTLTYVTNDGQGMRIHGLYIPDDDGDDHLTIAYEPPLTLLRANFGLGEVVNASANALNIGKAKLAFEIDHTSTVLGEETIKVVTGTYETVKLRNVVTVSHPSGSEADRITEVTMWLARGLGMVKSELVHDGNTNKTETQEVIFSTKVYLPEPSSGLQAAVGLTGLSLLNRLRARQRARRES